MSEIGLQLGGGGVHAVLCNAFIGVWKRKIHLSSETHRTDLDILGSFCPIIKVI